MRLSALRRIKARYITADESKGDSVSFVEIVLVIAIVVIAVRQWFIERDIKALAANQKKLYSRGRKRG